jgi:uncharacterized membrane protein YphA (DoxX/SURF4 family)
MDVVFLIGRILFGALFLATGMAHLTDKGAMAGYAESKGVKPGRLAVLLSGVVILASGLMIILGLWIDLAAILLALFLLSTALVMHNFWTISDEGERQNEMVQSLKDLALCGGALMLLYLASELGGDAALTITDPLFID